VSRYAVIDRAAGLLSPSDVGWMLTAIRRQLQLHVAPAWNHLDPPAIRQATDERDVHDDETPVYLLTKPGETAGLGDRIRSSWWGRTIGRVFAGSILDAAPGCILWNPMGGPSVCAALGHECAEGEIDSTLDAWLPAGGGRDVAGEICDPDNGTVYELPLAPGILAHVPNFMGPRWFDCTLPPGPPCDFLRRITTPLEIAPGGYAVFRRADGTKELAFGSYPPAASRLLLHFNTNTRTMRRLGLKSAGPTV
jgi:hypothetical protein